MEISERNQNKIKEFEKINTFIINLPHRKDRLSNILNEFKGRNEFQLSVVKAEFNKIGNLGLWNTMQSIIRLAKQRQYEYVLICEDDHQFTSEYDKDSLFNNISESKSQGAHLLIGGISGGFSYALPLTKNRIWLDVYFGNQFIIFFKDFYDIFLQIKFDITKTVDVTISHATMHKMTVFPFISTQKNFGYSDVTRHNSDDPDAILRRFELTEKRLAIILKIFSYYY